MQDVDCIAIDWLTDRAVAAASSGSPDPYGLRLLLRRYATEGRDDLADTIGLGLAAALEGTATHDEARAEDWLTLFVEAASLSDDDRLPRAAGELVRILRQRWGRESNVESLTRSVDACLAASQLVGREEIVSTAVDELERIIAAAYRPGAGVAHDIADAEGTRGRLADQVRAASALLTAYERTRRLPYAMLAEELMQSARRTLWDEECGGFLDRRAKPFVINCDAARVLCRLAALHDAEDYQQTAVVAAGADYRRDAHRTLAALGSSYRDQGAAGAIFGLAINECFMR
jgi:uncharacterized protein YyaL (SSP411 family)